MARLTKGQREAEYFRTRAAELLQDPDWLDEEVQRWLSKELERERDYIYSEKEHAAMRRIIAASTLFDGWGGYTVPELIVAASKYVADYSYEEEMFVKRLQARGATKLRLGEMHQIVGLCRFAGFDLPRFDPEVEPYDEAA
jgi:hypothetical protein